tara:strand:- start:48 stop:302 length:255 start_codon:yes stop_codon:yes gene_type:complete
MSLTKGQIHKLKGKLSRVNPESAKAKRIRIQLGLETAPVVEAVPEPVVEAVPVVEVVEVVAEAPAPKPKAKRSYRRRKTTTTKE